MSRELEMCISCLESDNLFNIFDTHECEGIVEIYSEMLRSCFNIEIANESTNYSMCEKCILALRQAHYFKQNVMKNLKELEDHILKNTNKIDKIELDPKTGHFLILVKAENNETESSDEYEISGKSVNYNKTGCLSKKTRKDDIQNNVKEKRRTYKSFKERKVASKVKNENASEEECQYECADCRKKFSCKLAIARHLKTHLDGPFSCHICQQVFTKLNSRNSHLWRVHQSKEPYVCSKCGERFTTFHKRLVHLQTEHKQLPQYPCPYCDNKYFYAGARSQHIRGTHLRVQNHPCTHCHMAFFKRRSLLSHLASIHGIGEKKFECSLCNKSFFRNVGLQYHMKRHTEQIANLNQMYQCHICPANFTLKAVLKNHLKCHELESQTELDRNASEIPHSAKETHHSATETHHSATETHRSATETQRSATETYRSVTDTPHSATETYRSVTETYRSVTETYRSATETLQSALEIPYSVMEILRHKATDHLSDDVDAQNVIVDDVTR